MHEKGDSQGSVLMALPQIRVVPLQNKKARMFSFVYLCGEGVRLVRKMIKLLLRTRNGCTNPADVPASASDGELMG